MVVAVVCIYATAYCGQVSAAVSAANAAYAGASGSQILFAAALAYMTAGAFQQLNAAIPFVNAPLTNVAANALMGGVFSVVGGGKFGHGFASAGISAAAGGYMQTTNVTPTVRILAQMVIGGTASVAAGGKFGNGAITAAFIAAAQMGAGKQGNSGEKRADSGKPSTPFGPNSKETPNAPDRAELSFVRSIASEFQQYGNIEACALVCNGANGYALSNIISDGSHIGCDTAPAMCPAGMVAVSDIHNHPPAGSYRASAYDLIYLDIDFAQTYNVSTPVSFSSYDLSTNVQSGLNGWVIPNGTDLLLYFDHTQTYTIHQQYPLNLPPGTEP